MALYTILFGISIFMIALLLAIIKTMFFHWKEEHKIDTMAVLAGERPAICVMLYTDKCLMRRRRYAQSIVFYDLLSKSDISLLKKESQRKLAVLANISMSRLANASTSDLANISNNNLSNSPKTQMESASSKTDLINTSKSNMAQTPSTDLINTTKTDLADTSKTD